MCRIIFFSSSNVCATVHFLFPCLIPSCPGKFIYFLGRERVFFLGRDFYTIVSLTSGNCYATKLNHGPKKKKKFWKKKRILILKRIYENKKNQSQNFSFAFFVNHLNIDLLPIPILLKIYIQYKKKV